MVISKLLNLSGEYRHKLIFGAVLRTLDGLLSLAPVFLLFVVLHGLISGGRKWNAGEVLAVLVITILTRFALYWLALRIGVRAGFSIMSLMRERYAEHVRRLPMGWFYSSATGDITGPILQDLQHIEPFLVEYMAALCSVTVQIVFCLACVTVVDGDMTLLLLAGLIPATISMLWVNRRLREFMPRRAQALSGVTSAIIEFSQGINVIKAFGVTAKNYRKYEGVMAHNRDINIALINYVGVAAFFYFICLELGYAALIAFGTPVSQADMTIDPARFAALLFAALMALRIYGLAASFVDLAGFVKQSGVGLERIETIGKVKPLPPPRIMRCPEGNYVEFAQVGFSYGEGRVLRDVSFCMEPGTMTALVGASGSGKTTVANLLCRFWDVQKGSIRIGGTDVRDMSEETLWQHVSIVFQHVHLFSDTVAANIRLGKPGASDAEIRAAAEAASCHDFIMEMPDGYDTVLMDRGGNLSGGQRQRLSIARAILKNAPIIILDEATASVDVENERRIQNALSALVQEKTVLVIAHRLSTVVAADQILVLQKGIITERGNHADLLKQDGYYSTLWKMQRGCGTLPRPECR
jgi:ATP-binding cassette subfamily B protein